MDADRRTELARRAAELLPELRDMVVDSWTDLLPAATTWRPEAVDRARRATAAAVAGLVALIEQGDLDDRTWHEIRQVVLPHGYLIASELLRAVVIVGAEAIAEHLTGSAGLTHDERWLLQQEAAAFSQQVLGEREEVDAGVYDALLEDLERAGPDVS